MRAKQQLWDRIKAWFYRLRHYLLCAALAGPFLAHFARGPARLALLCAGAAAAGARACAQIKDRPDDRMEAYVADIAGVGDVTEVGNATAEAVLDGVDKELTKGARKWLRKAKLHFGDLKDTTADRICLKRWLAEQMKGEDMRDKDACGMIPVVVTAMFIPTLDDVLGAQLADRKSVV